MGVNVRYGNIILIKKDKKTKHNKDFISKGTQLTTVNLPLDPQREKQWQNQTTWNKIFDFHT